LPSAVRPIGAQLSVRAAALLDDGLVCAQTGDEIRRIANTRYLIGLSQNKPVLPVLNRIGQESACINVVNFTSENSIEESVLAAISLKEDLFHAALDGSASLVDMGADRKRQILERLREMTQVPRPAEEPTQAPEEPAASLEQEQEPGVDLGREENAVEEEAPPVAPATAGPPQTQSIQEVLENGLRFLSGLSVLAGGRRIDREGFFVEPTIFTGVKNSMRIAQMPKVESIVMPSGGFWGGVGEPTICVVTPAVVNAIHAATGKPVRQLPLKNQGLSI